MTVVTEGHSQDGPRPTPNSWSRLQERTTDQGQYLTCPLLLGGGLQLRAQHRVRTGFLKSLVLHAG